MLPSQRMKVVGYYGSMPCRSIHGHKGFGADPGGLRLRCVCFAAVVTQRLAQHSLLACLLGFSQTGLSG